ncbi:hypothetical protein BV25DRAFT_1991784 [Artomyces pyxidatus]|uniref:Uncharacterized protein n=1 Tax=Artomyces pyxidatus TaxID=48021 RepID=A0ACB8T222_9AGAM|nr:hypothetical protein BV25DRAFT_1991784 [Artomyces pyxidatus]
MSIYTPVFPSAPIPAHPPPLSASSSGTSTAPGPSAYSSRLSHLHLSIASVPYELCPPSPSSDIDQETVAELRKQIRNAVVVAHHDPTSGKWGHVSTLVKLGCTRGRYEGVGRQRALVAPADDAQYLLAETDQEWLDWEAKREKHRLEHPVPLLKAAPTALKSETVVEKVKKWQATVPAVPVSQPQSQAEIPVAGATKRPSPLGFPVVKRSNSTAGAARKGEPAAPPGLISRYFRNVQDPNIPEEPQPPVEVQPMSLSPDDLKSNGARRIDDVSDEAFLPPSFPSQLYTSTPPPIAPAAKRKISPIPRAPSNHFLLSPVSSPPPFPRTQAAPPKRLAEEPDGTALKRRRIASPATTPPDSSTPAENTKLTSSGSGLGNAKGLPVPNTPERGAPHKDLKELLASSRRSRPRPRPPSRKSSSVASSAPDPKGKGKAVDRPSTPPQASPAKTYFSSPASGSSGSEVLRARSPVSPLFPLDFTHGGDVFAPQGASTQPGGGGVFGAMGYNSQFDVEGNVDRVNELLDGDVNFGAWLRDTPMVDDEDQDQKMVQDGLELEY